MSEMTFGKYAGKGLGEIPRGYLRWVLSKCELSDNMRTAIECVVKGLPIPPMPKERSLEDELQEIMQRKQPESQ